MSGREPDVPFRKVLGLCERHGFRLMRIVGQLRVFGRPYRLRTMDPRNWCSIQVLSNGCVSRAVFRRLQEFLEDFSDDGR